MNKMCLFLGKKCFIFHECLTFYQMLYILSILLCRFDNAEKDKKISLDYKLTTNVTHVYQLL